MTELEVLNLISGLLAVAARSADAARQIQKIVDQAKAEGRSLNDSDVAAILESRRDGMARWNDFDKG